MSRDGGIDDSAIMANQSNYHEMMAKGSHLRSGSSQKSGSGLPMGVSSTADNTRMGQGAETPSTLPTPSQFKLYSSNDTHQQPAQQQTVAKRVPSSRGSLKRANSHTSDHENYFAGEHGQA